MNKVTPWIIRGVIVAVYIALAIAEAGTYLADMYDVSMILFYIVIGSSLIGLIVHSICILVHFVMLIIRLSTKKQPLKSLIAMGLCLALNTIILIFGFIAAAFSFPSASV